MLAPPCAEGLLFWGWGEQEWVTGSPELTLGKQGHCSRLGPRFEAAGVTVCVVGGGVSALLPSLSRLSHSQVNLTSELRPTP